MTCKKCGEALTEGAAVCSFCGEPVTAENTIPTDPTTPETTETPTPELKPEKTVPGIIGAIVGALIGGASIVLLSQLGYIASISGFLIAFLALKGYEWMAGRLTTKGIVLSIVLCLVVPMLSYLMSIAIAVTQEIPELSIGQSFSLVMEMLLAGELWSDILSDLLMLYGFTALGAFSVIRSAFAKKK